MYRLLHLNTVQLVTQYSNKTVNNHKKHCCNWWQLFLTQLSRCGWFDCWMIRLWTVGPFDYNLTQIDDYTTDNCVISPMAFLSVLLPCKAFTGTLFTYNRCQHLNQLVKIVKVAARITVNAQAKLDIRH